MSPSGKGPNVSKQAPWQVGGAVNKHRGLASAPLAHYGAWLLWGLYAKFAERYLDNPPLAFHALEQAGRAALSQTIGGPERPSRRCLTLIARAQFHQRWPRLESIAGRSDDGTALEGMFVEAANR